MRITPALLCNDRSLAEFPHQTGQLVRELDRYSDMLYRQIS